jgi:putative ABC transport system substrate-binding protein
MNIRRRDFITLLGGTAAAWPIAARAQQPGLPVVAFVSGRSPDDSTRYGAAFRKGLNGAGIIEGQHAAIEYHWLDGHYDQLPALTADLIRRRVAVVATFGGPASTAAKAATATIPIVFAVADDPTNLGLVANLARPSGNATGINFFSVEIVGKRLGLLHELVPKATRIAVLVNPANTTNTESTLRDLSVAARALGMQTQVLKATSVAEIDAAFESLASERADALFPAPDGFFDSRRVQFATLAARYVIPTAHIRRDYVEAGGLMSYGTDLVDVYRQVGDYAGRILKGAKPADLPVQQTAKFEFAINVSTAKVLGLDVPPALLLRADAVIE